MKSNIVKKLNNLKEVDVYTLVLFTLFKLREDPGYATLSELSYVLNKENLFRFLEFFGGSTIKVPTPKELKIVIYSLMLYQYVNLEGKEFKEALKLLNCHDFQLPEIKEVYLKVCDLLTKYDFRRS